MRKATPPPTIRLHHQAPVEEDFQNLSPQEPLVEHLTIPGFLRRIPHRWHLDDINRFGDKVGRAAESMQLAYITAVDRSLGVLRVFPIPLLQRVYEIMAPQFGWPRIIDAEPPALGDSRKAQRETLKAHERVSKHLRDLLGATPDLDIQHSIAVVIQWVEFDCKRIRKELGIPEPQEEETV